MLFLSRKDLLVLHDLSNETQEAFRWLQVRERGREIQEICIGEKVYLTNTVKGTKIPRTTTTAPIANDAAVGVLYVMVKNRLIAPLSVSLIREKEQDNCLESYSRADYFDASETVALMSD